MQLNDGRCGYRRIFKALQKQGHTYSFNRVRRRIQLLGLKAVTQRKFKATTDSNHDDPVAPNLLARDFSTTGPNQGSVLNVLLRLELSIF